MGDVNPSSKQAASDDRARELNASTACVRWGWEDVLTPEELRETM